MKFILLGSFLVLGSASFLDTRETTYAQSEMIHTEDRKIFSSKEMIIRVEVTKTAQNKRMAKCSNTKCWSQIINSSGTK